MRILKLCLESHESKILWLKHVYTLFPLLPIGKHYCNQKKKKSLGNLFWQNPITLLYFSLKHSLFCFVWVIHKFALKWLNYFQIFIRNCACQNECKAFHNVSFSSAIDREGRKYLYLCQTFSPYINRFQISLNCLDLQIILFLCKHYLSLTKLLFWVTFWLLWLLLLYFRHNFSNLSQNLLYKKDNTLQQFQKLH